MSQLFKNPLTTPGLISTVGAAFGGPEKVGAAFFPQASQPATLVATPAAASGMPTPTAPAPARVGYTPDDSRWKKLQSAGSSDTILSPPSQKLGG